jgi:hypothetical protein
MGCANSRRVGGIGAGVRFGGLGVTGGQDCDTYLLPLLALNSDTTPIPLPTTPI